MIDLDEENCNEVTTTVWQGVRLTSQGSMNIPPSFLGSVDEYAVACSQIDSNGDVLVFSKTIVGNSRVNSGSAATATITSQLLLLD